MFQRIILLASSGSINTIKKKHGMLDPEDEGTKILCIVRN